MKRIHVRLWVWAAILGGSVPASAARLNVAVFNFQMRSATPEWVWVEKGLADQITTDFSQSTRLTVTARDDMQLLASKCHWAPEMATADTRVMDDIRKQLKIDDIVTGSYAVENGRVEILVQVVNVDTRKEVHRKAFSGDVHDVLALQKRISAHLLSYYSGVPEEKILPELPLWTQSLPATRALYEGLHLYDLGGYEEAWLKFRQAMHADPSYLEARYWVGKMYYFMDRYEQARIAYEDFVREHGVHPRAGDAIKEYIRTFEQLDAPPEQLLAIYEEFIQRYPDVRVYNEMALSDPISVRAWLRTRQAELLGWMGRHEEAVALASAAMEEVLGDKPYGGCGSDGWAYRVAMENATALNMLTGKVRAPRGLLLHHRYDDDLNVLQFKAGSNEAVVMYKEPGRLRVVKGENGKPVCMPLFTWHFAIAPDGCVFKKLTVYPIVEGTGIRIGGVLHKEAFGDSSVCYERQLPELREKGLVFENMPPCGIFHMHYWAVANEDQPSAEVRGVRAVAEFEKVDQFGVIDVDCPTTDFFIVSLDGKAGRHGPGLIGLVKPGPHKLRIGARSVYASREETVQVEAGKAVRLVVDLPWVESSPWRGWSQGVCVGRDYPGLTPALQSYVDAPSLLVEEDAIRLAWSYMGDLWVSSSADGKRFDTPRRLPIPISSGWSERNPVWFRDESGKLILAFGSDREGQHQVRPYVCWSRDGVRWSRPSMVVDRTVGPFHLIQDRQGRYLWVDASEKRVTVMASTDAYAWEKTASLDFDGTPSRVVILQRDDGRYELFLAASCPLGDPAYPSGVEKVVWRYQSEDGKAWSSPTRLTSWKMEVSDDKDFSLSAVHREGKTVILISLSGAQDRNARVLREKADGTFEQADAEGVAGHQADLAYHPRWGYVMSWRIEAEGQFPNPPLGPYLICGGSFDAFFKAGR